MKIDKTANKCRVEGCKTTCLECREKIDKTRLSVLFFLVILFFSWTPVISTIRTEPRHQVGMSATMDIIQSKIAIETQIEERIRQIVMSYLNIKEVSVVTKITLQTQAAPDEKIRRWDDKKEVVLPGVPAATSMTKDKPSATDVLRFGISKISIQIIIGSQITDDTRNKIYQLVVDALDINKGAGDTVTIESIPVKKSLTILNTGAIVALICLIAVAIFLYGPFRGFLTRFNDTIASLSVAKTGHGGPGSEETTAAGRESASEMGIAGSLMSHSIGVPGFDSGEDVSLDKYVNENNIEDLALILENEPPEVIAKVIQRIPPKFAFMVIPKYKMKEVLEQFLKKNFDTPENIKNLMGRIKDKMAGSFGGEARLASLLQVMDSKSRESALSFIRRENPRFATEVETRFFKFEDLLQYDEIALRRIFRATGVEIFARCLKTCNINTVENFYQKLGPAIKELLNMRLQGIVVTEDNNEAELAVLAVVESLGKKGLIMPLGKIKRSKSHGMKRPEPPKSEPATESHTSVPGK